MLPSPAFLTVIGSPRPYVGFDGSNVDHAINVGYAGLTWDYHVSKRIYLSGSLGASVNDAKVLKYSANTRSLGSNVGFHVDAAVGYDFTEA